MDRLSRQLCTALRAHLSGRPARPPEAGTLLWNAFAGLSAARTWHAHGPNPIGYAEIAAWCSLMRVPLEPAHVRILRDMDQEWLAITLARMKPGAHRREALPAASHPMSAEIFDAMMG